MEKITVEQAISMLAEIFEQPEDEIAIDTLQEDIDGWDSLGVLTLMAEFDERFNIIIPTEDLEKFTAISDLVKLLQDNGAISEKWRL